MGLDVGVSRGLGSWEEIVDFGSRVVVDVSESFNVGKPVDIATVFFEPDGSVEGHFVVLTKYFCTISSMALESLEKMSLKALSRSYSLDARSS